MPSEVMQATVSCGWNEMLAQAAQTRCMCSAEYQRQAVAAQMEADGFRPSSLQPIGRPRGRAARRSQSA